MNDNELLGLAVYEKRIRDRLVIDETSPSGLRWSPQAVLQARNNPAGTLDHNGYWRVHIGVNGGKRMFLVHRVIWYIAHGRWPNEKIDHINNNPADNRLANLRGASCSENGFNMKKPSNNTSSVKGVSFMKDSGKWQARIMSAGKSIYVGDFTRLPDAEAAVRSARERIHGEFFNHGD